MEVFHTMISQDAQFRLPSQITLIFRFILLNVLLLTLAVHWILAYCIPSGDDRRTNMVPAQVL